MKPKLLSSSLMNETDETLWLAFRNNDKEAFELLYYRYFPFLIRSCLGIVDDKDMIKDCVHDLFVELWKNKLNLGIPRSVKAYLCSSIHRKLVRLIKKRRRLQVNLVEEVLAINETDLSIEKKIIAQQVREEQQYKIMQALDSLTKRQKEAVYLKFYGNMSYSQMAGKMSISKDAIYNLVSKAIDNLRPQLKNHSC